MAVDPNAFKQTLAQWASGVTIVATEVAGQRVGITASSLASVSLDPPLILICVAAKLHMHQAIQSSGIFAVSILAAEHLELGMRFAGMFPQVSDRFAGIDFHTAVTGAPILTGALAWLDCRLASAHAAGDHSVFIGEVQATGARGHGKPLLYHSRHWRQLHDDVLTLT
jgi:flavin reductase (DIM6/NTAB) family NADH-FMN oxidoreductase RutF